jgi:hypothetical protein
MNNSFYSQADLYIRSGITTGSSVADFIAYIQPYPSVYQMTPDDNGGSDKEYGEVYPSTTFYWLEINYPYDVGRILWNVLSYKDPNCIGKSEPIGNCVIRGLV